MQTNPNNVFVYWDNSNIFHEAQRLAEEHNVSTDARYSRVRIHFNNLLNLALANRTLQSAFAAGSIPPDLQNLWNRLENEGVGVRLFDRGDSNLGEQQVPDGWLRERMLEDALRNDKNPGILVLLTGDGSGYSQGSGFHTTLELLHEKGWGIELLSWRHSCKRLMREWVERNGVFIALDDFYNSITFLEPSRPGQPLAHSRVAEQLDLTRRPTVNMD